MGAEFTFPLELRDPELVRKLTESLDDTQSQRQGPNGEMIRTYAGEDYSVERLSPDQTLIISYVPGGIVEEKINKAFSKTVWKK